MKRSIRRIITVMIVCAGVVTVRAQTEPRESGFLLLEEPVSPRMAAMGEAGTAIGGTGFSYYNPVKPFYDDASYVSFEYGLQSTDVTRGLVEGALVFPHWFVGANFRSYSTDFTPATEQGPSTSISSYYQLAQTTLGAGFIVDRFSLGIAVNGIEERIDVYNHYGVSISGGMGFKIIPEKLTVGIAGFNEGYSTGLLDSSTVWSEYGLPRTGRAGVAWCDTIKGIVPYTASVDVVYRDEDRRIMVPVGIEVWPIKYIALRIGKLFNHDTEVFSAGIGLKWANFNFDASFTTSKLVTDYEVEPLFGLTYVVNSRKKAQSTSTVTHPQPHPVNSSPQPSSSSPAPAPSSPVPSQQPSMPQPGTAAPGIDTSQQNASNPVNQAQPDTTKKVSPEKNGSISIPLDSLSPQPDTTQRK